jgi:hypothetical protein
MATEQKRARGDDDNGGDSSSLTHEDLDEFRKQLMVDVDASISKSITEFGNIFGPRAFSSTAELVKKLDVKTEKRFSTVEKDLNELRHGHASLQRQQEEQQKQIKDLQQAMAVAEATVPIKDTLDFNEFNRQVDSTILRINTGEHVNKGDITRILRPWLLEADCDESEAEIMGHDVARRFIIQFKGSAGLAVRYLKKAQQLLRDQHGSWRTFDEPQLAASGGSTKLYIDFDKNACQQKRERDGKRLKQSFQQLYPSKVFNFNRADGLFTYKGVPLALREPQNDNLPSGVKWNLSAVADAEVDRDAVLADFKTKAKSKASASDVAWSGPVWVANSLPLGGTRL